MIASLLAQPEGKTLEFKRDLSSPKPLLKTLVVARFLDEQVGAQSGDQSLAILQAMISEPQGSAKLISLLGLKSKTGSFKRAIGGLLERSLIEYTLPEKPNSRLQQYRLTIKGRALIRSKS